MSVSISMSVQVPELLLSSDVVRLKIRNALERKTGPRMMREFNKTTQGWEHQINFYQRSADRGDEVSVTIYTRFKQYAIVNFGSPPHPIYPKRRNGMLRFQLGYRSATKPRIISSQSKQRSGPIVGALAVNHRGFKAREFDQTIAEKTAPDFLEDVQEAIRLGSSAF